MLQKHIIVDIKPTVEDLASEFCHLDDDDMAKFFDKVKEITDVWEGLFETQLLAVVKLSTPRALALLRTIGEYANE